jgi:hypothetical protein
MHMLPNRPMSTERLPPHLKRVGEPNEANTVTGGSFEFTVARLEHSQV